MYMITPSDQRSAFSVYRPSSTSGATYEGDPTWADMVLPATNSVDIPKSTSTISDKSSLSLSRNMMFSGLMSRCVMPR